MKNTALQKEKKSVSKNRLTILMIQHLLVEK